MVSHAYRKATNYPMVSVEKIFTHLFSNQGYGSEGSSPVCYHRLKDPELFYVYDRTFFAQGNLRKDHDEILKIWHKLARHPMKN